MSLIGHGHQTIVVSADGQVIATFQRSDVLRAHCLMVASYYVFGIGWEELNPANNKPVYSKAKQQMLEFIF